MNYNTLDTTQLRIQAASVTPATYSKYTTTLQQYLKWTEDHHYDTTPESVLHWWTYLALHKQLLPTTLNQKLSHLQFFSSMGLLPLLRTDQHTMFIKGLTNIVHHQIPERIIPPTILWSMFNASKRSLILDAILYQAFTGLRLGQMLLITPNHILLNSRQILPPFKKCRITNCLPLHHVHPLIISRFLSHATHQDAPIISMSADQYAAAFASILKAYKVPTSTHAARHSFATIQSILKVPIEIIAQYLLHVSPLTTKGYLHPLSPSEVQAIMQHPELFITIQPIHQIVSSTLTAQTLLE